LLTKFTIFAKLGMNVGAIREYPSAMFCLIPCSQ